MSEIKPVYQVHQLGEWIEVEKHIFDELYIQNKFPHRILYPAAAYEALQKENDRLTKCLIGANANHEQFERQYYLELNKVEDLTAESAAQAKRIAEFETPLTDAQIASACLSHRHDFGLLTDFQRISIFNTAKSLEECFRKERELSASKNGE